MSIGIFLPGDEIIAQTLAEFLGYTWCRFFTGQVIGERIVRFLASNPQVTEAKVKFGPNSIGPATGDELVEQLAFKSLPHFSSSLDAMVAVEETLHDTGMHSVYLMHLRSVLGLPVDQALTVEQVWAMITASARARASAAYLTVDAQRPKQQRLL